MDVVVRAKLKVQRVRENRYKWILKDVTFDKFQIDLAELDELNPITNAATMNDKLTKNINSTAT